MPVAHTRLESGGVPGAQQFLALPRGEFNAEFGGSFSVKRKVMMASLDTRRPAAQQQLKILGEQTGVPTLPITASTRSLSRRRSMLSLTGSAWYESSSATRRSRRPSTPPAALI